MDWSHDGFFEICNILVPSAARIDAGGDAVRQVVGVGEEPSIKAAVHVQVDVDEAGGDVEAGDIGFSLPRYRATAAPQRQFCRL